MDRDSLQQSGLPKFLCTCPMRANIHFLENLIGYSDHDLSSFDIQGEILEITVEDMYFITWLSCRGMHVNLKGTGKGGDPMSVQYYVVTYCMPGSQKKGSCIPIVHISNFPLKVVVSTIVQVARSSSLHLATWTQMRVVVEFLQGTVFDWCSGEI